MTLTYYLTVDGVNGGSTNANFKGAFAINGYDFAISSLFNIGSGGAGTGKAIFSPLAVDLNLTTGLTTLFSKIASGAAIPSIQLEGVTSTGDTVYDLKLGNVLITQFRDTNESDSLVFDYSQVILTTTPQNPNGSLGAPITTSWDLATNSSGATIVDPVAAGGSTANSETLTYFLTVDGVNGGSTNAQFKGTFELGTYDFEITNLLDTTGGGGASAGKAVFSPLEIALNLTTGLPALLNKIASGSVITSVQVEGVTTTGAVVYDLKLGNVFITEYRDTSESDSLVFDYSQVVLTTTPQNPNGSLGAPITASWNLATNSSAATVADAVAGAGSAGSNVPLTYYLAVDGINGGSTSEKFKGAFDIATYGFDVANLPGTGGSAGKANFSPLVVNLDLNSGLTSLLSKAASGQSIKSIRLAGVTPDGAVVYDLKLGDVFLTQYQDTSGSDTLSFDYSKVVLTTSTQNPDGSLGAPVTTSWNIATNQPGADVPIPVIPPNNASDPLTGFNGGAYIASYFDLINAFGYNPAAGQQHYLQYGIAEGRRVSFEADDYLASYGDLIQAFGYNLDAAIQHYITFGVREGRSPDLFDEVSYLNKYADLQAAFGNNLQAATQHYIAFGYQEGRTPV